MRPPGFHTGTDRVSDDHSVKPTPDPTVLTTDAIALASRADRDWVRGQLAVLQERLNGIDKATEVLSETVNRFPTLLDREIAHLRERTDLQFGAVGARISERDEREELRARDSKVAIDAALAAQKEAAAAQSLSDAKAIAKAELNTGESINKLGELLKITTDALEKDSRDLKERVGRMEAVKQGGKEQLGSIYALAAFIATVLIIAGALAGFAAAR